jgi:hypothetical protein
MQVIKSSGLFEKFNPHKIYRSVRLAGGSRDLAMHSVEEVKKKFKKNVSSQEILKFLVDFLKKEKGVSERYNLKRAIMSLGPSGFPFEKFVARVLEDYGFKTKVGVKIKGKNILHEIDIVAVKDQKIMIECKYHNEPGIITRLHPALYTYARFLDLQEQGFERAWLVTNTKCSKDAINYSKGVGLRITSWNYPRKESLKDLIREKQLYPITILTNLGDQEINKLYGAGFIIIKDLLNFSLDELFKKTKINKRKLQLIIKEVKSICGRIN